ncbi:MAG: type 2 isopentenyl-diphosphate Delta-isomerase, partial [Bdellovibrionota bacterium]
MDIELFASRKRDHIRLALDPAHQAEGLSALDRVRLVHEALPELDFSEIFLDSPFLGENDLTPFYVAGMTAGHEDAPRINRLLAEACAARGWVMGVGSQRRELGEKSEDRWSEIRASFPKLKLLANIGISQLITASTADLRTLVERLDARALVVHVNALQEALQVEGTPNFRGALPALARVCRELGAPVVLKETGCGFSEATLRRLAETGLAAIDVSGLGGTHWGRIEGARAPESSRQRLAA